MKTILFNFKMLLVLLFAGFALSSCSSDDDKGSDIKDTGLPTAEKIHQIEVMLVKIIRDSGRDFPQFDQSRNTETNNRGGLDDFLEGPNNYMETKDEPGKITLRLWLDDEGNIIPSPTWQQNNPNYCLDQGRYMRPARELLQFKIMYDQDFGLAHPDGSAFGVQLNLINVENALIKQSVYVDPIIDDANNWINATLNEAWDQMLERATIGGAIGPCEAEIVTPAAPHTYDITIDGQRYFGEVENVAGTQFYSGLAFFEQEGGMTSVGFLLTNDAIFADGTFEYPNGQENSVTLDEEGESAIVFKLAAGPDIFYLSRSATAKLIVGESIATGDGSTYIISLDVEFQGTFIYNDADANEHPVQVSGTIQINLPPV